MNIVMLLAGGSGTRVGSNIPKQFIEINGKPIIAYTMEIYQKRKDFDAIEVVCIEGYEKKVWEIAKKYNITKLKWVIKAGKSGQESAMRGVYALEGVANNDDILFEAMSVSPLIDNEVIDSALEVCKKYGNSVTAEYPPYYFPLKVTGERESNQPISRKDIALCQMPMVTTFGKALEMYKRGEKDNVCMGDQNHIITLLMHYGESIHFSKWSRKNFKITTQEDIDLFKAYLLLKGEN